MMQDIINYLKVHGSEIGKAADLGDELSQNIIEWYCLLTKTPGDPGAQAVLKAYIEKYQRRKRQEKEKE